MCIRYLDSIQDEKLVRILLVLFEVNPLCLDSIIHEPNDQESSE